MSSSLLSSPVCLSLSGALLALGSSPTLQAEQLPMDFGPCGELCACCQGWGSPVDSQSTQSPAAIPVLILFPHSRTGARSSPEDAVDPTPPPQPGGTELPALLLGFGISDLISLLPARRVPSK